MNKNIRKLQIVGGGKTYIVSIPKDMIRELKWIKGQKVTIALKGETLVIKDWKR